MNRRSFPLDPHSRPIMVLSDLRGAISPGTQRIFRGIDQTASGTDRRHRLRRNRRRRGDGRSRWRWILSFCPFMDLTIDQISVSGSMPLTATFRAGPSERGVSSMPCELWASLKMLSEIGEISLKTTENRGVIRSKISPRSRIPSKNGRGSPV